MKLKRYSLVGALFLVAVLLLSACAAAVPQPAGPAAETGEQAAAGAPVTVTWAFWGSPEERASHERVAAAFMEEHPEIKIEIWHQPWDDYFTKIQALWASGDASVIPDVAFLWPTPRYAAEGVLENLDPFIEQSGYSLDDYWPGLLESAKFEGHVYGFPRDIEVNILYYNKDIFDEAGVAYPDESWTWDDLVAAAEKLTVKDNSGNTTRYALAAEGGKYTKWVNQNGGGILDDYRNPSRCTLSEAAAVGGIQFFVDLMNNGYAMRPADLSQAGGDAAVFQSGQAAMILQNSSRISSFNAADMNYDVAVVPIPADGKRWNPAGGAAWVMSSASDNKDAAWTFLSWLQSTDGGQMNYTVAGEVFPALQSVANSPAFMNPDTKPETKGAFITEAAASDIGSFGYFPEWGELDGSIIGPGLELVWAGEVTPEDGTAQICEQVDAFLAEHGYPK
ncbi:MAG: sugar ABC transporter substrate-binding protein [Caldilineaceae bacterium]|nr:sugar ABC transporter substrate-binding protein [Caldilineaceae bacterium]